MPEEITREYLIEYCEDFKKNNLKIKKRIPNDYNDDIMPGYPNMEIIRQIDDINEKLNNLIDSLWIEED